MSDSQLATYKAFTNNSSKGREGKKIDKIFVHHMAGQLTIEQCGNVFKNREASAHYGIGKDGRIGQYVHEADTAWHCGNWSYNCRSIGIECANDGGASSNWHVADKTIETLILLIVDICKRNNILKINYTGDLTGNICLHCWTQATACPGGYLKSKMKFIAEEAQKKLASGGKGDGSSDKKDTTTDELYRVRKTWKDAASQVGAYKDLANAKKVADETGLNVYNSNGTLVYPKKTTTVLYRVRKTWKDTASQVGAYKDLNNAKKVADEKGLNVYDHNGKLVYSGKTPEVLYRVRKTWKDADSQVGAYKSYNSAKAKCDKFPGYSVYDSTGKRLYTSPELSYDAAMKPLVDACKAQTDWSYGSTYEWQSKPTVAKSKTKGTCVTYVACVLQRIGILNSGEYIWHDGKGYGTGKVYGQNSYMDVIYTNNKTPSQLKSQLKVGDVVMIDDNKSGVVKDGGHTEIFSGTIDSNGNAVYYSGGLGSGHNTSNTHKDKRKILAIVRMHTCRVETYVDGGTISPWSLTLAGRDVKVTYKPDKGKKISELWINKKKVDIGSNTTSYTFKKIWTNNVIKVVFK